MTATSEETCLGCHKTVTVTRSGYTSENGTLQYTWSVEAHDKSDGTPCVLMYRCPQCKATVLPTRSANYHGPECPACRATIERIPHLTRSRRQLLKDVFQRRKR